MFGTMQVHPTRECEFCSEAGSGLLAGGSKNTTRREARCPRAPGDRNEGGLGSILFYLLHRPPNSGE